MMSEKDLFLMWVISMLFSLFVQIVGEIYVPEIKNVGIIIAIFLIFCLWKDSKRIAKGEKRK